MKATIRLRVLILALLAASLLAACGSSAPKPSVEACTKAYPAWFLASAAAHAANGQDHPTATPAACKGLTDDQITRIAMKYLESQSG